MAGGRLDGGDPDVVLTGVAIDSRAVRPGDLFVALAGEHTDGHRFLGDAVERGASAVLVHEHAEVPAGTTAVRVDDPVAGLQRLAAGARHADDGQAGGDNRIVGEDDNEGAHRRRVACALRDRRERGLLQQRDRRTADDPLCRRRNRGRRRRGRQPRRGPHRSAHAGATTRRWCCAQRRTGPHRSVRLVGERRHRKGRARRRAHARGRRGPERRRRGGGEDGVTDPRPNRHLRDRRRRGRARGGRDARRRRHRFVHVRLRGRSCRRFAAHPRRASRLGCAGCGGRRARAGGRDG